MRDLSTACLVRSDLMPCVAAALVTKQHGPDQHSVRQRAAVTVSMLRCSYYSAGGLW